MAIVKLTEKNFEEQVIQSGKTVLIDFYADWCGPCRMLGPIVEEIAAERPDVKVCKVNVDEEGELAARFGVMSIPAVFVLKNGEVVAQSLGAKPKAQLLALLG